MPVARINILIGTTAVRIRILIGMTVVRIRILISTTVVRIASVSLDASGRWRHVCTPSKLAAVIFPRTWALLPHLSTGSDRYTDTTTIRDQHTVQKLTLNPLVFRSPVQSTGRAIVVTLASALALALPFPLLSFA